MYIKYNNYDFRGQCYACLYQYRDDLFFLRDDPPFLKLFPSYPGFSCPGYYEGARLIHDIGIVDCQNPLIY